jgi:predicted PurR-regulated permease PerM
MIERRQRDLLAPLLYALIVILVLAFLVFRPFLLTFAVAASVAVLLAPVQDRLGRSLGRRSGLAASILVLITTAAILVPVLTSFFVLGTQAVAFFAWITPHLQPPELEKIVRETLPARFPVLRLWLERGQDQLMPFVSLSLSQLVSGASALVQQLVAGFTMAAFELALFLLMLFFLLRDGGLLRAELRQISPFSEAQEAQIFDHLGKTVKGVLQAMVVVPLAQGFLAAIGFWIFGVPSPVPWGVAVVLAAMVPILGSPLGWVPACVYLYLEGATWQWVGMLLFGILVISGIDNVIKPLLLKGAADIHPMLGFLSILGGVVAFGFFGFLVGPVILSLVLSAFRIYRLDILRPGPPNEASHVASAA